jgi:hypothetical protein
LENIGNDQCLWQVSETSFGVEKKTEARSLKANSTPDPKFFERRFWVQTNFRMKWVHVQDPILWRDLGGSQKDLFWTSFLGYFGDPKKGSKIGLFGTPQNPP